MKFKKEDLKEIIYGGVPEFEVISSKISEHTRWSVGHEVIFKFGEKFYKTHYYVGATEEQDESPYEYDDEDVECKEVFPKEKTIIIYEEQQ